MLIESVVSGAKNCFVKKCHEKSMVNAIFWLVPDSHIIG